MASTLTNLLYHVVFSTKGRLDLINEKKENELHAYMGGSSKWMNESPTSLDRFNWQAGYGAFSVSESQAKRVLKYISDQKLHHQGQSFENELRNLLIKHGVSYDDKYILD